MLVARATILNQQGTTLWNTLGDCLYESDQLGEARHAYQRALAVNPTVLLVDELSMGLAPKVVEELYAVLAGIARHGLTILVVEQFAAEVLKVADSGALLINGRITYHGAPGVVGDMISSAYLGGEHAAPAPERVLDGPERVLEGQ